MLDAPYPLISIYYTTTSYDLCKKVNWYFCFNYSCEYHQCQFTIFYDGQYLLSKSLYYQYFTAIMNIIYPYYFSFL